MSGQLERLLERAAAAPVGQPDLSALYRRGRSRRRRSVLALAVAVSVVLVAGVLVAVPLTMPRHQIGFITAPTQDPSEALPTTVPTGMPSQVTVPVAPSSPPQPALTLPPSPIPGSDTTPTPHPTPTPSVTPTRPPSAATTADPQPAPSATVQHRPYLAVEGVAVTSPIRRGDDLVIRYTNTGGVRVIYGVDYSYERWEAGRWVPAGPYCPGGCIWESIGYTLEPGESAEFTAGMTDQLLPGRHRIIKGFADHSDHPRDPREGITVSVEFDVAA